MTTTQSKNRKSLIPEEMALRNLLETLKISYGEKPLAQIKNSIYQIQTEFMHLMLKEWYNGAYIPPNDLDNAIGDLALLYYFLDELDSTE